MTTPAEGLEISQNGDADWNLTTVERPLLAAATATLNAAVEGEGIVVTIPEDLALGADGNDWDIRVEQGDPGVPATIPGVRASIHIPESTGDTVNGVTVTMAGDSADFNGVSGNDFTMDIARGDGTVPVNTATAIIVGTRVQVRTADISSLGSVKDALDAIDDNGRSFTTAYVGTGAALDQNAGARSLNDEPFTGGVDALVTAGAQASDDITSGGNGMRFTIGTELAEGVDGNDWDIEIVQHASGTAAQATVSIAESGNGIKFTIPATLAEGAAGNNWEIVLNEAALGEATSVVEDSTAQTLTINYRQTATILELYNAFTAGWSLAFVGSAADANLLVNVGFTDGETHALTGGLRRRGSGRVQQLRDGDSDHRGRRRRHHLGRHSDRGGRLRRVVHLLRRHRPCRHGCVNRWLRHQLARSCRWRGPGVSRASGTRWKSP